MADAQGPRTKGWCFTINNPDASDEISLSELALTKTDYIVWGEEIGAQGTRHYQGFMWLKAPARLTAVKKFFRRSPHLEPMRGSPMQASDYCKKDRGIINEHGQLPEDGRKKGGEATKQKFQESWNLAKEGKIEEIDPHIRLAHYNTLKRIERDFAVMPKDLDEEACGYWFYGPPRTGKSWHARNVFYPEETIYLKPVNKWFDGYRGQDKILLEDVGLDHEFMGYHLKIWADRYAFAAEQKGSTINVRPKRIIVTSNHSIEQIFGRCPETVQALKKRFVCTQFALPLQPY